MDLLQLRYFMAVAEVQNITLAAKKLYITQPALSNAIARLEKDLDIKLFQRGSNSIVLTEAGSCFLGYVNSAMADLEEGIAHAKQIATRDSDTLRIASSLGMIRSMVDEYCSQHNGVKIDVAVCDTPEIISRLQSGEADLGINLGPIVNGHFLNRTLMESRYFIIFNSNHPLAGKQSVSSRELNGELLLCSNIAHTYEAGVSIFERLGCNCTLLRLDEKEVLFEAARKGLGSVFCLPMIGGDNPLFSDEEPVRLLPVPIADCTEVGQVVLVSRKDAYFSGEKEAFIYHLSRRFYAIGEATSAAVRAAGL